MWLDISGAMSRNKSASHRCNWWASTAWWEPGKCEIYGGKRGKQQEAWSTEDETLPLRGAWRVDESGSSRTNSTKHLTTFGLVWSFVVKCFVPCLVSTITSWNFLWEPPNGGFLLSWFCLMYTMLAGSGWKLQIRFSWKSAVTAASLQGFFRWKQVGEFLW